MVSPSRKRQASRSPEGGRYVKKHLPSSPEEGEVDDSTPSAVNSTILPISLPSKHSQKNLPFPFKKKQDGAAKNGTGTGLLDRQQGSINVFEKLEEDLKNSKDDSNRNRPRIGTKHLGHDHWEPEPDREVSLLSRIGPLSHGGNNHYHPGRDSRDHRDRDRRRSPLSRHSPTHSHSPGPSYFREKHRLPSRSPLNFSPPREFSLDHIRDRSRDRYEWDRERHDDSRRYHRRNSPTDERHYRPSYNNDYRRSDDREWTRRDRARDERNSRYDDRSYDYHRRYELPRQSDSRESPRLSPPKPIGPSTPPYPAPIREVAPSDMALSHSPYPPPPPADAIPRPPSSTPPPAPPPDIRLMKDPQLPPIHAQVKITMRRPDAPRAPRSPLSLNAVHQSTASAMANGAVHKGDHTRNPPMAAVNEPNKAQEWERIRMMRKRLTPRRSEKAEVLAYGHGFKGCGQQSDYDATSKLGEGTFGEVHKAIHKSTGTIVALKRILMHNEKEGMPVTALREIKILKALKHSCIVDILDMFVVRSTEKDPLSVYMVFPYMDHDLAGLLENERVKLQPSHIKLYMKQLLEGTEYMHRNNILHRDMKAANLLISNNGSLKIADFGLARTFHATIRGERQYTNCVVTRWYRPPELLMGARLYGGEVDMWGIGCVLGEMFTRKPILPGTSDLDQLEKIWYLCGSPNQHNWPYHEKLPGCEGVKRFHNQSRKVRQTYVSVGVETAELLDALLVINPKARITASQALDHHYFWTDPLPADPKTLPSYEASHEFDKRGHRNHPPMPPPVQHHNNQFRQPPPGNLQTNRGGQRNGPHPPHPPGYNNVVPDVHRRNGVAAPNFMPYPHSHPPPHPPPPILGSAPQGPLYRPPSHVNYPGPSGPYQQSGPPQWPGQYQGSRKEFNQLRNPNPNPNTSNQSGPPMRIPSNLPPKPALPLGSGFRENERNRTGTHGDRDRRGDPPPPGAVTGLVDGVSDAGPPVGVLNYG